MAKKRVGANQRKIDLGLDIMSALKKMDELKIKLLLVTKEDKYHSLLSIGDIQRAIIKNVDLATAVSSILRPNIRVSHTSESHDEIKSRMLEWRTELMPVVNQEGEIERIWLWDEMFDQELEQERNELNIPVVIMAGGTGTRLRPITNIIPKPLVPVGEKSMIEIIIDNFRKIGCKSFYATVNYKHKLIENHFADIEDKDYEISFHKEEQPLGTAGSLYLLKEKINDTFFISNCDILIDQDYRDIYNYHKEHKNELTLIASLKSYQIPYGTVESGENGELLEMREKPELTFKINSGMYILEPHLLDEIPENSFFHITELIDKIKKRGGKVGVFPVSEKSWFDIGQWSEYQQTLSSYENRFTWSS